MVEFALDQRGGLFVSIEVCLLASYFQMAAARKVAVDIFFADDPLDTIDRFERSSVHSANCCPAMALDQRGRGQLHSGEDPPALPATATPSQTFPSTTPN